MKKVLAIVLAIIMVLSLAACGGGGNEGGGNKTPTYPKLMGKLHQGPGWVINELYLWNERMETKVYTYEILPDTFDVKSGEKLPVIIFTHGNRGNADSLISEPKILVADGIAGFTFECCGGSAVAPKSDVVEVSTSSRVTDLETVIDYVKTLDWVDKDRIYIYGQSQGGKVVMLCAPHHNDDIAGVMIESSGIGDGPMEDYNVVPGTWTEFLPAEGQDWRDYVKGWKGDVIIFNSELDGNLVEVGEYTKSVYDQRDSGTCEFYFCPQGAHTFNAFSEEGQQIALNAMRKMVLGE
ncbi:MAG: acetylxylan esterase [Clostridia bacterium]|nr:acetylxylan esterase [Clostridia bacterium]MBR2874631.1 acetylxylan esterase [Clostridia bacterium]